jgi:intracellular sulfur oxidation DsrE/DsrF family protein
VKKLWILLALVALIAANAAAKKVVFDLTTGDVKTVEQKLVKATTLLKTYYEGKLESLDIAVVIHGEAYRFFVKDLSRSPYKGDEALRKAHADLRKRLTALSSVYDVEFIMCERGMKRRKLEGNVYGFVKTADTYMIGLIDKENEGYAYIPIP